MAGVVKKLNEPQSTHCGYDKIIDGILKREKDFTNFNDILDKGISNIEIIKASKRLKNGKAVGGDAICNEMIKCFVHTRFIDIIRAIFNAIYSKSYFPKLWKVGYIIPIFKSDYSFDPSNYRGVTESSCLGKLFTLVINERLIEFLDVRNILSHYQIGFRRGYRTGDNVFILNTILNSYFSKGNMLVCFIDFSKAYDSVWRNGLLYKLILNGLSLKFILLIKSMYTELQATVKLPLFLYLFFYFLYFLFFIFSIFLFIFFIFYI